MKYQIFDYEEIKNCNKKYISNYCRKKDDKIDKINNIILELEREILNNEFEFNEINWYKQNKTYIFTTQKQSITINTIKYNLVLNTINYNLQKLFSINMTERNTIINNLKHILTIGLNLNYHIYKVDIKNFFESIHFQQIIISLYENNYLSNISFQLLNKLHDKISNISGDPCGLPRGLSLSTFLSEYKMQKLDKAIKQSSNIIYYARYVDDIIVISTQDIRTKIKTYITDSKLQINNEKEYYNISNSDKKNFNFDYLGYNFSKLENKDTPSAKPKLQLAIATKKINKIKSKLYTAFKIYEKNNDINNLLNTLKELSTLQYLSNKKKGLLKGLKYTYDLADQDIAFEQLKSLDTCYYSLKNHFIKNKNDDLNKISFESSFKKHIVTRYNQYK